MLVQDATSPRDRAAEAAVETAGETVGEAAPTALFVAAFDSQLKWCGQIRDELVPRGFRTRVVAPDGRVALSSEQVRDAGFDEVEVVPWAELLVLAATSDVVVSALSGPLTQALLIELPVTDDEPGPVLVCGWVGVIIEKITAGYLDRCAADVIAVNAVQDLDHFRDVARRLDLDPGNLLLSGLPLLGQAPAHATGDAIRRVVFADQPTVPKPADERAHLYHRLIDYARAHPDREVVLKPRHRPGEDTFHRMRHHPESLLAGVELPANFSIDYTAITELLPQTDLVLTVSSTACLEALDHGCRVGLILDLGVHERHGNHVFLDSGLLRTFDQLIADDIGTPDPQWHAGYFFPRSGRAAQLIAERALELVRSGQRPGRAVRGSAYFRSAAEFHARVVAPRRQRRSSSPLRRRLRLVARTVVPSAFVPPLRRGLALLSPREGGTR